ncbi:MAG: CRP/FNR family cyclic AMP-dependent transcriptional regulator [bacterium]|jgi:CRP/FNR family cyclic AMP-dependent transcriptional regulator
METQELIQCLKRVPLFNDVADDPEKMDRIISIIEVREYKKGSYIFKELEQGDELFILNEGAVQICKTTRQNEEYTIVELKAEDNVFFGEMALMDNDVRSASIRVLSDCSVSVIGRDKFEQLGNQYPEIGLPITRTIVKKVCKGLRGANEDVILLFDALVDEIQESEL